MKLLTLLSTNQKIRVTVQHVQCFLKKGIFKKACDFLKIIGKELNGYLTGSGKNNIVPIVLSSTDKF